MVVCGDRGFKEVIKAKYDQLAGAQPNMSVVLLQDVMRTQVHTERPGEDTGRRQTPTREGERPQKKSALLIPRFLSFSLQDCEKIN